MNVYKSSKKRTHFCFAGLLYLLLSYPLLANATVSDEDVSRYVQAYQAMLEAQITQLYSAINLLSDNESLSDQERFERIGEPSFSAIDKSLADKGFTLKSLHRFQSQHQADINQWLSQHSEQADMLSGLLFERDQLIIEIDNTNALNTSSANTYSGNTYSENQGAADYAN